jgi:hypothetical protein
MLVSLRVILIRKPFIADFAVIGVLTSHWASLTQHALFISVLTCYSPLSLSITNFVSGFVSLLTNQFKSNKFSFVNRLWDGRQSFTSTR